jgi:hypothetical protein
MQDEHMKLNPGLARHKQLSRNEDSFRQQIGLECKKKKLVNCNISCIDVYVGETWTLRKAN